jgi:NADH:ubiquinone oxidoreductase subunit 6 (subunit J)
MNMMTKRKLIGAVVAVFALTVLASAVFATGWGDLTVNDSPERLPTFDPYEDENEISTDSLTYVVFETYGPMVALLSLVMFGAMVGAICVAKEEVDDDDTN